MTKIQDMTLEQIHVFVEKNYVHTPDYLDLWIALKETRQQFRDGLDSPVLCQDPNYEPTNMHIANSNRSFGFSTAMEIVAEHLNIGMEY